MTVPLQVQFQAAPCLVEAFMEPFLRGKPLFAGRGGVYYLAGTRRCYVGDQTVVVAALAGLQVGPASPGFRQFVREHADPAAVAFADSLVAAHFSGQSVK